MNSFIETGLQKSILLIGGIIVFLLLTNEESFSVSLGFILLTGVLLTVTRGFHPSRKIVALMISIPILLIVGCISYFGWTSYKEQQAARERNELIARAADRYHRSEGLYQKCLDKVAALDVFTPEKKKFFENEHTFVKKSNKYTDEWVEGGRVYFKDPNHWEWGFMKWMMQNHRDFCQEFEPETIDSFLKANGY